jgi:DNA repair exonuclease SbcCD nuclease subunit
MPITLPPISRRRFLAGSVAAAAALAMSRWSLGDEIQRDPNHFVLIADTHIDADATKVEKNVNMTDNLTRVAAAIIAMKSAPAAVLHGGDLAHSSGQAGDYAGLIQLLKPMREAGLPIHLMLGNHDNRERFWAGFGLAPTDHERPVEDKHITIVESPKADWYLLDSLDRTQSTPGVLGEKQLAWLAKSLDAKATKPAIVYIHHNPEDGHPEKFKGLTDTKPLMDIISPRKQVKLLVFGHTHDWQIYDKQPDGLHRINLPPTAYVFKPDRPNGYVDCRLTDTGGTFKLVALDEKHPQHGQVVDLKWR